MVKDIQCAICYDMAKDLVFWAKALEMYHNINEKMQRDDFWPADACANIIEVTRLMRDHEEKHHKGAV